MIGYEEYKQILSTRAVAEELFCDRCGREIADGDDYYDIGNDAYCENCVSEETHTSARLRCCKCKEWEPDALIINGEIMCIECAEKAVGVESWCAVWSNEGQRKARFYGIPYTHKGLDCFIKHPFHTGDADYGIEPVLIEKISGRVICSLAKAAADERTGEQLLDSIAMLAKVEQLQENAI